MYKFFKNKHGLYYNAKKNIFQKRLTNQCLLTNEKVNILMVELKNCEIIDYK